MKLALPHLRIPIVILILMVLSFCIFGYVVARSILVAHLQGDNIRLETKDFQIEFPKQWFGSMWEEIRDDGKILNAQFYSINEYVVFNLKILDEKAEKDFLSQNNLTDMLSISVFEVKALYNWSLQNNELSTLHFIENGSIMVSNRSSIYTQIKILEGLKDGVSFYPLMGKFVTCLAQGKLVQISFWGKEGDWNRNLEVFQRILDSITI